MRQESLFPAPERASLVPGLVIVPDYVDAREEQRLLERVEDGPWELDFRRRIQQYGLGYAGDDRALTWIRDFPPWLAAVADRLVADRWLPRAPDNCVINDYTPGVGIGAHRDFPAFGSPLAALSLLSDVVIDFSRGDGERVPIEVPARSLWIASGDARWRWRHAIAARQSDQVGGERRRRGRRISLTFRLAARR